jgi:hypothetical protein
MYTRWAGVLDCVVRLDADDAVLIPRIRTRESAHRIKQMTDRESSRFLSQRRGSMSYILAHVIDRSPGLRVLSHDTSSRSTEALAELLLHELGE